MTFKAILLAASVACSLALTPTVFAEDRATAPAVEPAAGDVSGTYTWEQGGGGGGGNTMTTTLVLKQDGTKLTGTLSGRGGETPIDEGSVDGKTIKFSVTREWNGNKMTTQYTGTVTDAGLKLTQTTSREIEAKKST